MARLKVDLILQISTKFSLKGGGMYAKASRSSGATGRSSTVVGRMIGSTYLGGTNLLAFEELSQVLRSTTCKKLLVAGYSSSGFAPEVLAHPGVVVVVYDTLKTWDREPVDLALFSEPVPDQVKEAIQPAIRQGIKIIPTASVRKDYNANLVLLALLHEGLLPTFMATQVLRNGHEPAWQKLAKFLKTSNGRAVVIVAEEAGSKLDRGTRLAPSRFRLETAQRAMRSSDLIGIEAIVVITAYGGHSQSDKFISANNGRLPVFRGLSTSDFKRACEEAFADQGEPKVAPVPEVRPAPAPAPAQEKEVTAEPVRLRGIPELTTAEQNKLYDDLALAFASVENKQVSRMDLSGILKESIPDINDKAAKIYLKYHEIIVVATFGVGKGPKGKAVSHWGPGKYLIDRVPGLITPEKTEKQAESVLSEPEIVKVTGDDLDSEMAELEKISAEALAQRDRLVAKFRDEIAQKERKAEDLRAELKETEQTIASLTQKVERIMR